MAIKISSLGTIPAVDLNRLQYSQFNMTIGENPPHKIAVSGKVRPYGMDGTDKVYAKEYKAPLTILDLDSYIMNSVPAERQAEAVAAVNKVQEGLGVLAAIYYGVTFEGVE